MPIEPITSRSSLWLHERLPLAGARELLAKKVVPAHDQSIWYLLGGITLLAFGLLIITGILLAFHYQPGLPAEPNGPGAHASIRHIVEDVPHGWWIRSIHHWSAHLMIAGVMLHLLSTLLMKAYRKPREFTWWTGLMLAGLAMAAGFTGYLLPWTSLSFAATRVGAGIAGAPPLAGPLVQKLLLGGSDVSGATLTRFFGLHVVVLPLAILALTGLHLCLVIVHGSDTPPSRTPPGPPLVRGGKEAAFPFRRGGKEGEALCRSRAGETPAPPGTLPPAVPFWPDFALREMRAWLIVLVGLVVVASFLPPAVGSAADPLAPTPDDIRPEWYFLGFYRILKLFPTSVLGIEQLTWAVLGGGLVGAGMVALPFLDEPAAGESRSRRRNPWLGRILLGLAVGLAWLMTALPGKKLPGAQGAGVAILAGVLWLAVGFVLYRLGRQRARVPATLFGCVLASGLVGYVGWEAFGEAGAWRGLALTWVCLGLISLRGWAGRAGAAVVFSAGLLTVIALGGELFSPHAAAGQSAAVNGRVPLSRVHETAPVMVAGVAMLGLLLVFVQMRLRHQHKLRAMGLEPVAAPGMNSPVDSSARSAAG